MFNILLIGCGKSQKKFINSLKKKNLKIYGVDKDLKNKSNVNKFINISTYHPKKILNEISRIKYPKFNAILSNASGPSVLTTAIISNKLNLPSSGKKIAMCSVSKYELYKYCKSKKIPCIPSKITKNYLLKRYARWKKMVVKPDISIIGKKNVYLTEINNIKNIKIYKSINESLNKKIVIQPFIEGNDMTLTTASKKGKIIWYKFYKENNIFRNGKLIFRKESTFKLNKNLKIIKKALYIAKKILNYEKSNGFVSFCFRISKTENKIFLYEMNPGLPSDNVIKKIFKNNQSNINFYDLELKLMTKS